MEMKIISASAGSGKTTRLSEELFSLISGGGAAPEEVIAVTFTNAAAAELHSRVRSRFFQGGLIEQSRRLDGALIGTIHSVCERLVRRFAFEAGISPGFEVLPEEDYNAYFSEALSSIFDRHAGDAVIASLERFSMAPSGIIELVRRTAELARQNRIGPDALKQMAAASVSSYMGLLAKSGVPVPAKNPVKNLYAELKKAIDGVKRNRDSGTDTTNATNGCLDRLRAAERRFSRGAWTWYDWEDLRQAAPGAKSRDLCGEINRLAAMHLRDPLFASDIENITMAVFGLASDALAVYDGWKKERSLIDFTDMEEKALDLLEKKEVLAVLGREYKALLVDEFQDTSPLQLDLFCRLGDAVGRAVWVGDKKQCIYGFRSSDPSLMESALEALKDRAEVEYLGNSYRSRPALVEFTNHVFRNVFGRRGYPEKEVCLGPVRNDGRGLSPALEYWLLDAANNGEETAAVANGIALILDPSGGLTVEDRATGKVRRARPGDIAVLYRQGKHCGELAEALSGLGIPVSVEGGGLMETEECRYVHAAMAMVIDGRAALPALTMAHLAGGDAEKMVDERIGDLARAGDDGPGPDVLKYLPAGYRGAVEGLRSCQNFLPPTALLDRVIEASGVRDLCVSWGNAAERLLNVEKLRSYAIAYEDRCRVRKGGYTFTGFYLYLSGLENAGGKAPGLSRDSVTLLTLHRSKGLEWPIVVAGGLESSYYTRILSSSPRAFFNGEKFDYSHPLKDRMVRYWPWPYGQKSTGTMLYSELMAGDAAEAMPREQEYREEERLFYVGFTRARDVLVLPFRNRKRRGGKPRLIDEAGAGLIVPEGAPDGDHRLEAAEGFTAGVRVRNIGCEPSAGAALPRAAAEWFARPEGAYAKDEPLYLAASALGDDVKAGISGAEELGGRLFAGMKTTPADDPSFGNIVHAYLAAYLGLPEREKLKAAEEIIRGARDLPDFDINPSDLVEASARFYGYLRSKWPNAVIHRELPLELYRDGQVIQGVADLVVEGGDTLHLFDHKTFPGTREQCVRKAGDFAAQLNAYKQALEKATGKKCATTAVHYPVAGMIVFCEF